MHPSQMNEAEQAQEFRGWFHAFERLGVTLLFSDNPPAVTIIPVGMASGVALQQVCRKLGSDLLAYAAHLGPIKETVVAENNGDDRIARMEAMVMALAAKVGAPQPEMPQMPHRFVADGQEPVLPPSRGVNHQFTSPVPGEHAPAPVAPRVPTARP